MKQYISNFTHDENGAVTVDFVVLTAAITTLGLVVVTLFSGGATGLANEVETTLETHDFGL